MTTALREAPNHDKLTCYTDYRCRRPACVERYMAWERDRLARQADGTWDRLIDATPVREHLHQLKAADCPPYRVAKATGIPVQSIVAFTRRGAGRRYRTSPATAAKILAVTVDRGAPRFTDATGTHRRIQALVAAGWPMVTLDRRLGYKREQMRKFLANERITTGTKLLIAATYTELRSVRPDRNGVPQYCARWARQYAGSRRWPTPAYWADRMDVIDDPHFEPLYGITRREIIAQDAGELMRYSGLTKAAAALRLGVSKAYVDHALRDHPEYALGVAA